MTVKFGRNVELFIDNEGQSTSGRDAQSTTNRITIKGLKINFKVGKSGNPEPNLAEVKVYNLSSSTIRQITRDSIVTLNFSYDSDPLILLATGKVTDISTQKIKPNVITTIKFNDSYEEIINKKISVSFGANTTAKNIIDTVVSNLKLSVKSLLGISEFKYKTGFAFNGSLKDLLNQITTDVDTNWSFQNNSLKIYSENDQTTAIVCSPETGLIGSPEQTVVTLKGQKLPGWRFKILLDPKIEPGGLVLLKSKIIPEGEGIFSVINIDHTGDSIEGDNFSEVEVVEYEN